MPIITFLSDFGTGDSYVGEMRGVLLTGAPHALLVDLTHDIPRGDVMAAAFVLDRCRCRYPEDTVHLAVVDPGVGTSRRGVACRAFDQYFVGPDNGLLGFCQEASEWDAVTLTAPDTASATFHGRDVFAPAALRLASGVALDSLGPPLTGSLERLDLPFRVAGEVGSVVAIDRFGNLISNLIAGAIPPDASLSVEGHAIGPLRSTYGDVGEGELLAYVGSGGTVEIAVRGDSAARRLGVRRGARVEVRR